MRDIGIRESAGSAPGSSSEVVGSAAQPSVEVVGVANRRRFTAEYKRRILDEVGRAGRGEIGLILRREGLYSSQLSQWRTERNGMMSKTKGAGITNELRRENQRLQKENARLKLKLLKSQAMLDLQKKAAEIMNYEEEIDESERSDS